jgi:hypothetical protein
VKKRARANECLFVVELPIYCLGNQLLLRDRVGAAGHPACHLDVSCSLHYTQVVHNSGLSGIAHEHLQISTCLRLDYTLAPVVITAHCCALKMADCCAGDVEARPLVTLVTSDQQRFQVEQSVAFQCVAHSLDCALTKRPQIPSRPRFAGG